MKAKFEIPEKKRLLYNRKSVNLWMDIKIYEKLKKLADVKGYTVGGLTKLMILHCLEDLDNTE